VITAQSRNRLEGRGVTKGGKGGAIPWAPSHYGGAEKSQQYITSTFFNTVHLLPKDLSSKQGGAKLTSCSGRHLTSLRPRLRVTLDYVLGEVDSE